MLVKCAGADKAAADPKLKVTLFAPSDEVRPPWSCYAHLLLTLCLLTACL
jgi:hypothetical protein